MFSLRFRSLELLYSIIAFIFCQELFSKFLISDFPLWPPLCDSFWILPHPKPFVKNFFRSFSNFFDCIFQFCGRPKQLLYFITTYLICQELFSFLTKFDLPDPIYRRPCGQLAYTSTHLTFCQVLKLCFWRFFCSQKGSAKSAPFLCVQLSQHHQQGAGSDENAAKHCRGWVARPAT